MERQSRTFSPLVGALASIGVAAAAAFADDASGGLGTVSIGLINSVFGNIASDQLLKIRPQIPKDWWLNKGPDFSNHDLVKALQNAITKALRETTRAYIQKIGGDEFHTRAIVKKVEDLCERVGEEFLTYFDENSSETGLQEFIDRDDPAELYQKIYDFLGIDNLKSHGANFLPFVQSELPTAIQAGFVEELKDKHNTRPWVAYQRLLLTDIQSQITSVNEQVSGLKEVKSLLATLLEQLNAIASQQTAGNDELANKNMSEFIELREFRQRNLEAWEKIEIGIKGQLITLRDDLGKKLDSILEGQRKIEETKADEEAKRKKAFNQLISRQLLEAIAPHCQTAKDFLEKTGHIPEWEAQLRYRNRANEIIAYSLVGVIGIQWNFLIAIVNEDLSDAKQRKYVEKSLHIARHTLDLVAFALLSRIWDAQIKRQSLILNPGLRRHIQSRLKGVFEHTLPEQFELLKALCLAYADPKNGLEQPLAELSGMMDQWQENSTMEKICLGLHSLSEKLGGSHCSLDDCFEAESQLAGLLCQFSFLANYKMASIKYIGYRQLRNEQPAYLHRFAALGQDEEGKSDLEKTRFTSDTVHTDAVLLYRGDHYQDNVVLSPFVIDVNALKGETKPKICFYSNKPLSGNGLEYLFLQNHEMERIKWQGVLKPDMDIADILSKPDDTGKFNIDCIVAQFDNATECLLREGMGENNQEI